MSKIKMDFSKFKKIRADKDTTTLRHPDGHEITIAHSALEPKMRGDLSAIPIHKMADGGDVPDVDPKKAADMAKSSQESWWSPSKIIDNVKTSLQPAPEPKPSPKQNNLSTFAKGGKVQNYADGSPDGVQSAEAPTDNTPAPPSPTQAPVTINIAAPGTQPAMPADAINPNPGGQAIQRQPIINPHSNPDPVDFPYGTGPMHPEPVVRAPAAAEAPPSQPTLPAAPPSDASGPDSENGYKNQIKGIKDQAQAESDLAANQADVLDNQVNNPNNPYSQQNQLSAFQQHYNELEQERLNFQKDVKENLIKPDRYLNDQGTISKIGTVLGLILGGGASAAAGQPNFALEMLKGHIDRDVQAQRDNLGAKENLLSANIKQFGNLRDAADMTRVMQSDIVANQLKLEAYKATDPLVKARALQEAGKLEAAYAPIFQQLSMRRALLSNMNGKQDPASYVPYVVPEAHQKEVFKEITQAQNAAKVHDEILQQFDIAAKSPMKAVGIGPGSAAQKRMSALFLPMIHDQEGRVNEYEQATLEKLTPTLGDRAAIIASKRKGLEDFMAGKLAAPTAKAYGIDLNNYSTTSSDSSTRLTPQQQSYVKWARENPDNPKSQLVLKKLGLK